MYRNVLLVIVDALRADRVADEELTPMMNSMAKRGERFTSCYACADKTSTSLPTIQSGLYPTRHGLLHHGPAVTTEELERFSATRSIQEMLDGTHTTVGFDFMGELHMRGFDMSPEDSLPTPVKIGRRVVEPLPDTVSNAAESLYRRLTTDRGQNPKLLGDSIPREQRARWLTDRFINLTNEIDDPWFGFVHYWDTHMEYSSEPQYQEAVSDRTYENGDETIAELQEVHPKNPVMDRLGGFDDIETVGDLKRRYDAAVHCVDDHLGRLFGTLEDRGELSDTVVILTADHGESLTENGVLFDHREMYDQTWHVPLIIDGPGFEGEEGRFVQHFDIVPSILDVLDLGYDPSQFDGQSLVPDIDGTRTLHRDAVFAEQTHNARQQAIRTARYKYIRKLDEPRPGRPFELERPPEQLYDLEIDSGETQNIVSERPDLRSELKSRLDEWLDAVPEPRREERSVEHPGEDEELMDNLEALGYKFD